MNSLPAHHDLAHAVRCELAREILMLSGTLRLRVNGWSMLPTIWPGDTLVIRTPDEVRTGDIVLFERDGRLFVHRVIAGGDAEIRTRGDAMPHADAPVPHDQLLGRVACILRESRQISPRRKMRVRERTVAGLVRCSKTAARFIVGMKQLKQRLGSTVS